MKSHFEKLAQKYQYRLNTQRIEILAEFESFLYAQTEFLKSEITNIQVLEDIFYQLIDLANALETIKYIQFLETQIDLQLPVLIEEISTDNHYLSIQGHHEFYLSLHAHPERLNTFLKNEEGLISLHPHFFAIEECPQSDIHDAIDQEIQTYLHHFLSHQSQLPDFLYNQLNPEDFTVELLSILENPSFQDVQAELTIIIQGAKSNHALLLDCLEWINQNAPSSNLQDAFTIRPLLLHPLIEDAQQYLKSKAKIRPLMVLQDDQHEYEIQIPGPIALQKWFLKQELEIIIPTFLPSNTLIQKRAFFQFNVLTSCQISHINPVSLLNLVSSLEAKTTSLLHYLEDDDQSLDSVPITDEPASFLDNLILIQQQLEQESTRLSTQFGNEHGKHKWSLSGVNQKKFELSKIYLAICERLNQLIEDLKQHTDEHNFDAFIARAYTLKNEIWACLHHPANQRHNGSYTFFYNCEKFIASRENLKKIIKTFDGFLPEREQIQIRFSP